MSVCPGELTYVDDMRVYARRSEIASVESVIAALRAENAALRATVPGAAQSCPVVIRSWREGDAICAEAVDGRVFRETGKSHHEPPYVVDLAGQVWEAAR